MKNPAPYRRPYFDTQPEYLFPKYASTVKRAPKEPLVVLPHTLSELTAPVFGYGDIKPTDSDLTKQHKGEPQGERIVVSGRALDENGKPIPNMLIEIWQANAAGRYAHKVDQHHAPLDPNFLGAGRCLTDKQGRYTFVTIKPGAYPWGNADGWRPNHIHFSLFGQYFASRLVTQMYFPGDPLLPLDPIYHSAPAGARERLISRLVLETADPGFALGYEFDIVLRGAHETPMENRK